MQCSSTPWQQGPSCTPGRARLAAAMATVVHQLPGDLTLELTADSGEKQGLGLWTLGLAAARWASSDDGRRELAGRRVR